MFRRGVPRGMPGGRHGGHRGVRRGVPGFAVVILAMQIAQVGWRNIGPVTLALLGSMTALFYRKPRGMQLDAMCLHPWALHAGEPWRLVASAFFHVSELHLYFNMVSLLWKGRVLERKMGSVLFAYTVAVFVLATGLAFTALGLAAQHAELQLSIALPPMLHARGCAVGFSGVLFALKVVMTVEHPTQWTSVLGLLRVPTKYAFWAELLLIQLLNPNVSFLAHLAGILVGLLFVRCPRALKRRLFPAPAPFLGHYFHSFDGSSPGTGHQTERGAATAASLGRAAAAGGGGGGGGGRLLRPFPRPPPPPAWYRSSGVLGTAASSSATAAGAPRAASAAAEGVSGIGGGGGGSGGGDVRQAEQPLTATEAAPDTSSAAGSSLAGALHAAADDVTGLRHRTATAAAPPIAAISPGDSADRRARAAEAALKRMSQRR